MAGIHFVPQTGTKENDQAIRRSVRRHVMLGKNRGKTRMTKQPMLDGYAVFRRDDFERIDQPMQSVVPHRVGSDLSFLTFAAAVEPSLMNDTLQFCSTTEEKLFGLESCISFESTDTIATCLHSLAHDNLHLHIMIFGTQAYMNQIFWQTTSDVRRSSCKAMFQHYGQALDILRKRLADVVRQQSEVPDVIVMSIITLAMHALAIGDGKSARNHISGLSKLVNMGKHGLHSFTNKTKQMIELLRCDISISLATGQTPLLFYDSSQEPALPLSELAVVGKKPKCYPNTLNIELARIWDNLRRFCDTINEAAASQRKVPGQILLETMATVMYRLLNMPATSSSADEAIRLAMLSFCASAILSWRQLRIPFVWLRLTCQSSIIGLMQSHIALLEPNVLLWCLITYITTFSPLAEDEKVGIQFWLKEMIALCGLTTWDGVKQIVSDCLWVDILSDHSARKLVEETLVMNLASSNMLSETH